MGFVIATVVILVGLVTCLVVLKEARDKGIAVAIAVILILASLAVFGSPSSPMGYLDERLDKTNQAIQKGTEKGLEKGVRGAVDDQVRKVEKKVDDGFKRTLKTGGQALEKGSKLLEGDKATVKEVEETLENNLTHEGRMENLNKTQKDIEDLLGL